MPVELISAESTELFTGPPDEPHQIVRVSYAGCTEPTPVRVVGDGLETVGSAVAQPGDGSIEVSVRVTDAVVGDRRAARAVAADAELSFDFTVAEPGWTMFMISHFHYDPVWWNTQAAYTSVWTEDPPGRCRQTNGFDLVHAHLEMARREPEYKFVLAEVDYLKPYWDTHPRGPRRPAAADRRGPRRGHGRHVQRAEHQPHQPRDGDPELRARLRLSARRHGRRPGNRMAARRVRARSAVPGDGGRRRADVEFVGAGTAPPVGPDGGRRRSRTHAVRQRVRMDGAVGPRAADALHARPLRGGLVDGLVAVARRGRGGRPTTCSRGLKRVALTRNVLLPVGTDYTPPNKWVTEIHRDWNARYTWPRFVCALPREFFAAVRAELDERGGAPSPQTRDMNPIYTGKDVSYIDTKQANRAAENAVLEAERFAVFAGLLAGRHVSRCGTGQGVGAAGLRRAPRRHHRLRVRPGLPRPADRLARRVGAGPSRPRQRAGAAVERRRRLGRGVEPVGAQPNRHRHRPPRRAVRAARSSTHDGNEVPTLVEHDGHSVSWLARDVPSLGWRAYRLGDGRSDWLEAVRRQRDRQRDLPAARRPRPRRRGVVADGGAAAS